MVRLDGGSDVLDHLFELPYHRHPSLALALSDVGRHPDEAGPLEVTTLKPSKLRVTKPGADA